MRISQVQLIAGGEQSVTYGPKPFTPTELEFHEQQRISAVRHLAIRSIPKFQGNWQIALGRLGLIFEQVILDWLIEYGFKFDPRRTLYFKREVCGFAAFENKEVDGVVVNRRGEPVFLVEIRVSVQGHRAVYQKHRQLGEAVEIAQTRWPKVRGLLIFVRIGDLVLPEERLPRTNPGWLLNRQHFRLDALQSAFRHVEIPQLVVPFNPAWDYALKSGWELNPHLRRLANRYAKMRYDRRFENYQARIRDEEVVDLSASCSAEDQDSQAI
jgi:hypothetical protein